MQSATTILAAAALACAVSTGVLAQSATAPAPDMPGMAPMTMMPMPAVYMGEADKPGAPVFNTLGDHHHPISTKNDKTQMFFDQGVNLLFGFNHAEAIRSFREAARLDPSCAICWWGVAFALGPNINLPMPADAAAPAWDAVEKARSLENNASPEEREWIDALLTRYAKDPPKDRSALDEAFAQAMGKLWQAHPDDLDAGVFYAEAMMDTQPWDYWQADYTTPKGHGAEIVSTLESIIARAPSHPGALHLYIHAVEASTTPERAEAVADRLESLMPGAGHIVHMPSHIYYRVGRYADAAHVNELAAKVDEDYIAACKAQGYYPLGYYAHNIHFLWTSSEMDGRYAAAIDAARRLERVTGLKAARMFPQGQLYAFVPLVTQLRFGKWDAVLAEPRPPADLKLDTAISLYARGFAHANKGEFKSAARDRAQLAALIDGPDLKTIELPSLPSVEIAKLSLAVLDGEIARKRGDLANAVADFGAARTIELAIPYTEPPFWHEPVSHLLGAALLAAHRPGDAESVYRDSLTRYRRDGWALFGLAQALDAEGKHDKAATIRNEFATVWQLADVKLTASRF